MKKKLFFSFLLLLSLYLVFSFAGYPYGNNAKVVEEYEGVLFPEPYGEAEAYAAGVNSSGMPVFKNPKKALTELRKNCKKGLRFIQKKTLFPLNQFTWREYSTWSYEVLPEAESASPEVRAEIRFIGQMLDIYENSY